jgi:hypothetical protein
MGFFKNIGIENEVRKILGRSSPAGMKAGWLMPALSDMHLAYPTSKAFREMAERSGWKAQDVGAAAAYGIALDILQTPRDDPSENRMAYDFLVKMDESVGAHVGHWYDRDAVRTIREWLQERLQRKST